MDGDYDFIYMAWDQDLLGKWVCPNRLVRVISRICGTATWWRSCREDWMVVWTIYTYGPF